VVSDEIRRRGVELRGALQVVSEPHRHEPQNRALLLAGVAVAPFFYGVAIVQMFMRTGFDIWLHAISVLSVGDWGWIQVANFIIPGVLALMSAKGVRAALRGGTAGTCTGRFPQLVNLGLRPAKRHENQRVIIAPRAARSK
jgi:hypothetical protein